MLRSRRRVAIAVIATASSAAFALSSLPAGAVTAPVWPSAGRVPTGCDPAVVVSATGPSSWNYSFTDSSVPLVTSLTYGAGAARTTVIPVGGRAVAFTAKITEVCTGVGGITLNWALNGARQAPFALTRSTLDPFHATFTNAGTVGPDNAGAYRIYSAQVNRRYDSIVVDQDARYVFSTPVTAFPVVAGPWAFTTNYLLRQTTLATSQSAAKVRKGKVAKIFGQLRYATAAGYVADNGEKVLAQVKVGTKWVTKATLTASSTGVVTYSFAPTRTTQVRLVHAAVYSGRFTAAITSTTRTITVS